MSILCEVCGVFYTLEMYNNHINSREHNMFYENYFEEIESAARCRLITFEARNPQKYSCVLTYMEWLRNNVIYLLRHYQQLHDSIKYNMILECTFTKNETTISTKSFKTQNMTVFNLTDLQQQYSANIDKLLVEKSDLEFRGSGWAIYDIVRLELRINKYEPMWGSSSSLRFQLPQFLKGKKSLVNPIRKDGKTDNLCFKIAIMGKVLYDKGINVHNILNYFKYVSLNEKYNWSCISFPVKLDEIQIFEEKNNISINVYTIDEENKRIYPLKVTQHRSLSDHRDILFYKNHYVWIKNFESLVGRQLVKKCSSKIYVCRQCFKHFYKHDKLLNHEKMCSNDQNDLIITAPKEEKIYFKNFHRKLKIPFVVYCDVKYNLIEESTCEPDPNKSFVHCVGTYTIKSLTYNIVNESGKISPTKSFSNINKFIISLEKDCRLIGKIYKKNIPPIGPFPKLPAEGDICHICSKEMYNGDYVLDHSHTDGSIRGYAHSTCNLNFRLPNFVPVVFRDLSKTGGLDILQYFINNNIRFRFIPYKNQLNRFLCILKKINKDISIKFLDMSQFFPGDNNISIVEFEHIRTICLKNYALDMLYYLTIGAYSFDAMLKITNVQLDLLKDIAMYKMIKRGIRGGFVSSVKMYARANFKELPEQYYNPSQPNSYIYFYDIVSLYGKIMLSNPLPISNFKWVSPNLIDLNTINSGTGYILEVDLKYPFNVNHIDYPLCPEHEEGRGLVASFKNKYNYVIHINALKQALSMGLVLEKIHRVISFDESYWLVPYIKLNTDLRMKYSQDKILSNFFKLQSNIIYGKSIENVNENLNKYFLNKNPNTLMRLVKQPTFVDRTILNEDTYVVFTKKLKTTCNKPIYIGFSILDLSKTYMYDMYYNKLKKNFPHFDLIYTDNDSFAIHVFNNNNNFTKNHPDFIDGETVGLFKDQSPDNLILDFATVRCKSYGYRTVNDIKHLKNLPSTFNFENHNKNYNKDLKIKGYYKRVIDNKIHKILQNKSVYTQTKDKKRAFLEDDKIFTYPLLF